MKEKILEESLDLVKSLIKTPEWREHIRTLVTNDEGDVFWSLFASIQIAGDDVFETDLTRMENMQEGYTQEEYDTIKTALVSSAGYLMEMLYELEKRKEE